MVSTLVWVSLISIAFQITFLVTQKYLLIYGSAFCTVNVTFYLGVHLWTGHLQRLDIQVPAGHSLRVIPDHPQANPQANPAA